MHFLEVQLLSGLCKFVTARILIFIGTNLKRTMVALIGGFHVKLCESHPVSAEAIGDSAADGFMYLANLLTTV